MMHLILPAAQAIVEAIIPAFLPEIPFRAAPYNGPLESLAFGASPADGSRRFQILSGVAEIGGGPVLSQMLGPSQVKISDSFVARIRYHVPMRDGGYWRLHRAVGTDAAQICAALVFHLGDPCSLAMVAPRGQASLMPIPDAFNQSDAYILSIPVEVSYFAP
jgi:hypothetical protein